MKQGYPFHYDLPRERISDSETVVSKQCRDMIEKLFRNTRVAAVPNGGKRTVWAAAQAKREGMSKGFPDLVIVSQTELLLLPLVAFVELKATTTLTEEQDEWLRFLHACGHKCGVFRSDRTLEAKLREWGFQ